MLFRSGLEKKYQEAICQHYGFPTNYLDVTFSFDISLYFAENWDLNERPPEYGAIFAIPVYAINKIAMLVTLPPAIMRPALQSAKFILAEKPEVLEQVNQFKFIYRHKPDPLCNGLSQITRTTFPSFTEYIFPKADPIETIAEKYRIQE